MNSIDSALPAFKGSPRSVVMPPLEKAREEEIRQVLDADGGLVGDLPDPDLPPVMLLKIYRTMVMTSAVDARGWKLQRSGRIDFWIPSRGQEASHIASTIAMEQSDWIFMASREPGTMLARGASLLQLFAQFFGRVDEPLKGRRLPLLLGDRRLNIVPCMTIVGSYIPHAAGAAWASKLKGDDTRFIVYFGDGATSRGEFHSAMNFAGIHQPPIVFFCQNNGWAVSTPNNRQTAAKTFAEKGSAYKVRNLRVDGNDLYRTLDETDAWRRWDPIPRFRRYLESRGLWSAGDEAQLLEDCEHQIDEVVHAAEAMSQTAPEAMFDDVFETPTRLLKEQRAQLVAELGGGS
jgi:pyruvate dehydrogenase E1 component alpha subunit